MIYTPGAPMSNAPGKPTPDDFLTDVPDAALPPSQTPDAALGWNPYK